MSLCNFSMLCIIPPNIRYPTFLLRIAQEVMSRRSSPAMPAFNIELEVEYSDTTKVKLRMLVFIDF